MKITQLREKDGNLTLSTTDLDTFLQKIKTETKTQPVSTFRQQLRYCLPGKRCNEADRLPKVLPAAEFRKTNGVCQMKTYNGIVELTVGPLSGKSEIALVKRLAWEQPQTRLVFTGSSGRTVKIWTTFTRPNNSLPGKREEAEVFHAHAYRLAVKCYQPQLPFDILLKEPSWNSTPASPSTPKPCTARTPYSSILHSPSPCPTKPPIGKPCKTRSHP